MPRGRFPWVVAAVVAMTVAAGCTNGSRPAGSSQPGATTATGGATSVPPPRTEPPSTSSTTAAATPAPVLGAAFAPYQHGYGEVRPSVIDNGGDPTGRVIQITWESWGGPQATGTGVGYVVPADASVAQGHPERAAVVAGNLGDCGGIPAYRSVTWYYPAEGQALDPARLENSNICLPPQGDCRYDLDVGVEKAAGPTPTQSRLKITFTNRTIATCDITGYPTVTLGGPSPGGTASTTWTLVDQRGPGVTASPVTLGFEQSAFASLTYLPAASGGSPAWTPTFMSVALPGTAPYSGTSIPWSWEAIVFQASATNPGTYVGPVTAQ